MSDVLLSSPGMHWYSANTVNALAEGIQGHGFCMRGIKPDDTDESELI